jgi:hypothetical protein
MNNFFLRFNVTLINLKLKASPFFPSHIVKNKRGQTLVEFVLLLLVITGISIAFMRITNQGIGKLWIAFARIILDDPSEESKIDF